MRMNSLIALQGDTPDIVGNLARGQAAGHRARQSDIFREHGAGIAAGDKNALAALAGIDPQAAIGVQSARQGMKAQQELMGQRRAASGRAAQAHEAQMSAVEAQQQLERAIGIFSQAQSPEQFDQLVRTAGHEDLIGQFGNRQALLAKIVPIEEKLRMQIAAEQEQNEPGEYGLTPQYITGPDGSLQMVQVSKTGGPAKLVELPEGAALQKGLEKIDQGTHYQWFNKMTGETVGEPIPKNNREEAREAASGAAEGKNAVESDRALREMERNLPGILDVAGQLETLAEEATYTKAGVLRDEVAKQLGMNPTESAVARAAYIAVVDNQVLPLLRQTFGAAFTAKEGDTLRATLGDPDKSPAEKKAVLDAFVAQKVRDVRLRGGNTGEPGASKPEPFDPQTPDFTTMSDEELQAYIESGGS